MDGQGKNSKDPGKQLSDSFRDTLSSFFTRDRPGPCDAAVLTAYKELPNGEDSQINDVNEEKRPDSSVKDSCGTAEATGDPDLVQVMRVKTHSDTENKDIERLKNCTALGEEASSTAESPGPKGEQKQVEHMDEEEQNVPVFRPHMLREKSQIEAILFSSRYGNRGRSRPTLVSGKSKDSSKEKSVDVSLLEKENTKPDSGEQLCEEYTGVDCSQPVPSVISGQPKPEGPDLNGFAVPSYKEADRVEIPSKRSVEQSEEFHSTQTSSSVSSSLRASEKTKQSPTKTEEQPNTTEESKHDSPLSVQTPKTKTPKTTIGSPVSSASSPSKLSTSTTLSSPPSFQMPALFSGLRVLKKDAVGEDREVVSEIKRREKDADLALLSLKKTVIKARLFPEHMAASSLGKKPSEPKSSAELKSRTMESPNQLGEVKKSNGDKKVEPVNGKQESDNGETVAEEKSPSAGTPTLAPEKKKTTDLAYETFRSIFGPKTVKRETEEVDLDAVKRKLKSDKESLRSIFERTSKSPGKEIPNPLESSVRKHST